MCCARLDTEDGRNAENREDHEVELLMLCELIITKSKDVFCVQLRQPIRIVGSELRFDKNRGLVTNVAID